MVFDLLCRCIERYPELAEFRSYVEQSRLFSLGNDDLQDTSVDDPEIFLETGIELGARAGAESGATCCQRIAPFGATSNTLLSILTS
jgi:hypothetical protein